MHFAADVGTPIFDLGEIPLDLLRLFVILVVIFAVLMASLLVILLVLRKRITKNDPPDTVFEDPFTKTGLDK